MIVRADSLDRACELAEPILLRLPLKTENGRKVATYFHVASVLGETSIKGEDEAIICFPWYASLSPQKCALVWRRDTIEDGWETYEEYYGESPLENKNGSN
jgi:hypothetical protein